jgi:hypothetical protein
MVMNKKVSKSQLVMINIKLTAAELTVLKARAAENTGGNLSMWLRIAGTHFSFGENSQAAPKAQPNQLKSKLQS